MAAAEVGSCNTLRKPPLGLSTCRRHAHVELSHRAGHCLPSPVLHTQRSKFRITCHNATYMRSPAGRYKMRHFWTFSRFLSKYCSGLTSKPAFSTPSLRLSPV